jgi:hypothetical protein
MQREPRKGVDLPRGDIPRRGPGAECLVGARKPAKAGGAKGARHPARPVGQLGTGGADERGKAIGDFEAGGVEGISAGAVEWGSGRRRCGVDRGLGAGAEGNLYRRWNRLASGPYFPPPVREVVIPKRDEGERKLGIPTVTDRIAQTVVKRYVEPKVEPSVHGDSYGYRPGKSAVDAVGPGPGTVLSVRLGC